ncbi:MAG: polyprenyl synthetase family protein, partial [Rikenellaceae bacterium]
MISEKIAKIEEHIAQLALDVEPQTLYAPIRYIMEDGGKRMRPILTTLACEVYGEATREVYQAAVALEVFHNFTLLHDDIMDSARLRRGRETVHVRWSPNVAILSGDAMLILAYRLLSEGVSDEHLPRVISIFNKASIEVCEGQQYDMSFESADAVSMEEYLLMIRLKTAVLMAASLEI